MPLWNSGKGRIIIAKRSTSNIPNLINPPDFRWAHEGTLAYTSRDFHLGCFSRRGDVEVLFYNLIEWLGGRLPWDDLEDKVSPSVIQNMKVEAFKVRFAMQVELLERVDSICCLESLFPTQINREK